MAPESTALTTEVRTESPYKLDKPQTLKASSALLKHIKAKAQQQHADSSTKNLLATDATSPQTSGSDEMAIWLVLTGKKFFTDQQRLKPRKITLPHSLNSFPTTSICLITPEPQRLFKDTIAHPSFPTSLSQRITKVISIEKLEKKYYSFESKRQLRDSYDIFLADDRIITYLAKILGKTFYKTTLKRPIPVRLEISKPKEKKNAALPSTKLRKEPSDPKSIAAPIPAAREIERTLSTAQIHLSPSTTTAVKVGYASFTAEQVAANVEAVIAGLTDKLIAWRNIRAVHVKGPNTMALPIWLAEELWADEGLILEDEQVEEAKLLKAQKGRNKRKTLEGPAEEAREERSESKKRKSIEGIEQDGEPRNKMPKKLADDDFGQEMKERREKLRRQKKEARDKLEVVEEKEIEKGR